jgi:hypothetical protein
LHSGPLSAIRGATPASKNAFSHANRERNPEMAQQLFWAMLEHLQQLHLPPHAKPNLTLSLMLHQFTEKKLRGP